MLGTKRCKNCGRTIGRLETPHAYNRSVVCAACWNVLTPAHAGPRKVQTIEATGKVWKLQILLSVLLCAASTIAICVGISADMTGVTAIGAVGVVLSIAWLIFARIGAWWCHG